MALTAGTVFQIQATATTANVNGSGFNPANANMLTDLAATSANTASPVVTSASYNFVAGDVGNWVYVKSGTNWTAGWYQIASVAANAATLTAGVGTAILTIGSTGVVTTNSSAGCATVASPTAGTFTVDYSQSDSAKLTGTDGTQTNTSTTYTVVSETFTPVMVGNLIHLTAVTGAGALVGWYEIVSYTNATNVVLDRTATGGANITASTFNVGGAGNFNALEDTYQAMLPAASIVWVKNGSYTLTGAISTASTNGTGTSAIYWRGYNSTRGDTCNGANRPVLVLGANAVTVSQNQLFYNFSFTTTSAAGITTKSGCLFYNCKMLNNSTTASRVGFTLSNNFASVVNCEIISQNGTAVACGAFTNDSVIGCYIHDSNIGITQTNAQSGYIVGNIIASCTTKAIGLTSGNQGSNLVLNNTLYGREAITGIGIDLAANNPTNRIINNIIYGFTTGINVATGSGTSSIGAFNNFFNNTTDATNWVKDATDLALNPTFTGASQLTGTTATTTGQVLTDSGATFNGNITDNSSYLHVVSGTGVTVGVYLIASHTNTTVTTSVNSLGTSNAGNVVYWITTGQNFQIGTNLKAAGFPSFTNQTTSQTTSYPDIGAVQRQEPAGSTGGSFTFVG